MLRTVVAHMRAQWAGFLALFLVIAGGTAYAADTVFSTDIVDGQVKTADLADNAVDTNKIANKQVRSNDVRELSQFTEAASGTGSCSDDSQIGATCATANITLQRAGKLLLNATGEWHTANLDDTSGPGSDVDNTTWVMGTCQLLVDGTAVGASQPVGERMTGTTQANHPFGGTMALTGLSNSLPAGSHTVIVRCNENDGDLDWTVVNLTAGLVAD
jgi:hypothetical protein